MLQADLHGKRIAEAQRNEDYLTSTVFGHLRYLPCCVFWEELFLQTIATKPGSQNRLSTVINATGEAISRYESLTIDFWMNHPLHGEPDLLLKFRSDGLPSLDILIEAKLFSEKSSYGDNDQLVKYLKLLDDLPNRSQHHSREGRRFLVYLTQTQSQAETEESLQIANRHGLIGHDIFRLRWQDIATVAKKIARQQLDPARTILDDVARYLALRGLEPFDGFREVSGFAGFDVVSMRNVWRITHGFLLHEIPGLEMIQSEHMRWLL